MVVMAIVAFRHQFKPRRAVAEVETLHHPELLKHLHRPVDGGKIASALGQFREYLAVRQRMGMLAENFQDGRAGAGDFARFAPKPAGQRGKFLPRLRMRMGADSFHASIRTLATPNAKPTKTAPIFPTGNRW